MPKLLVRTSTWQPTPGEPDTIELALDGFIDAANYELFEKSLQAAYEAGHKSLILDFRNAHYINSTGISALIRFFELFSQRGGVLCLANVARPVGLSMHLLGVTSFLPFLKNVDAAREYVKDVADGRVPHPAHTPLPPDEGLKEEAGEDVDVAVDPIIPAVQAPASPGSASPRASPRAESRRIPLRPRRVPGLDKARVLVIAPSKTRFTRVLRLRFRSLNGDYHLVHDIQDALTRYDEMSPDLVVVDERSDPKGEFVNRIKIQKERSLTSIIKMYPKETDLGAGLDFKIWENDYLVEPFEVLELFTLTEAELCRVPKDRKVFHQQVHFEFKTSSDNQEKAYKLCDLVIRQSLGLQEDVTAFYAAVKEGLDNAVVHGNHSSPNRSVDVNLLVDRKKVTVIIEDQGEGFDFEYYLSKIDDQEAFEKAKKRILEEGVRGGLGILLMTKCSDRIEYSGAGNVLRLEKNV